MVYNMLLRQWRFLICCCQYLTGSQQSTVFMTSAGIGHQLKSACCSERHVAVLLTLTISLLALVTCRVPDAVSGAVQCTVTALLTTSR